MAGIRQENRDRIERELMKAARLQLASEGAAGLSLREIARELGMVSSAIYRYVASRDELLTRLITSSYEELGEAARLADDASLSPLARWVAVANAIRDWAIEHPHDYFLLYGSPVPGYAAPEATVEPGTRVVRVLLGIVTDADASGQLAPSETTRFTFPPSAAAALEADLEAIAAEWVPTLDASPTLLVTFVSAWSQMFGLISFELTSQTRGLTNDSKTLFDLTVSANAVGLGLTDV